MNKHSLSSLPNRLAWWPGIWEMMRPGEIWQIAGIKYWYLHTEAYDVMANLPLPPAQEDLGWLKTDDVGDSFMILDKHFIEDGTPFRCWVKILIGEHAGWILLGDHCLDNTTKFLFKNLTTNKTMGISWGTFLDEDDPDFTETEEMNSETPNISVPNMWL